MRPYRLGKRAEQQEETRQRIVDAAVHFHSTLGPARTTIAQIAERAGVQRNTYYAHFPDERSLFLACSARALEQNPLPDVTALQAVPAGRERVQRGLEQIYGWYDRNAQLAACILRDAEQHALTGEMVELRMAPFFRAAAEAMGEGFNSRARAVLAVALDFACWRSLGGARSPSEAAELMTAAVANL